MPFPICESCGKSTRSHNRPKYCAGCRRALEKFNTLFSNTLEPTIEQDAKLVVKCIRVFDRECKEECYTDTDRVWDLLDNAKVLLGSRSAKKRDEARAILTNAFPSY